MCLRRVLVNGLMCGSLLVPAAASADNYPVIAVPGKPGVPIIINGYDASWAVVNGDWGLYRPGAVPVSVIYPPPLLLIPRPYVRYVRPRRHPVVHHRARGCACRASTAADAYVPPAKRHYFPGGTTKPVLGRLEIESKRPPAPAQSFSRSWSTESMPLPESTDAPASIAVAPSVVERRKFHRPDRHHPAHRRPTPR
jgi:hypothetical protein